MTTPAEPELPIGRCFGCQRNGIELFGEIEAELEFDDDSTETFVGLVCQDCYAEVMSDVLAAKANGKNVKVILD